MLLVGRHIDADVACRRAPMTYAGRETGPRLPLPEAGAATRLSDSVPPRHGRDARARANQDTAATAAGFGGPASQPPQEGEPMTSGTFGWNQSHQGRKPSC